MKNLRVIGEVKRFKIGINNILEICKQNIQEYKNVVIPSKECFVRDIKELMKLHQQSNYKNKDKKKIEILLNRTAKFLKYDTEILQKLKAKEYYYSRVSFVDKIEAIDYNDDSSIKFAEQIIHNVLDMQRLKNILENKRTTIKAVDKAIYETLKHEALWKAFFISHNFITVRENVISKIFKDLTENDTEVNRETLLHDEVIKALNNSRTKFLELHSKQPSELKHVLIDYKETPLKDYLEVTENAINNSDDIKLLDKLFPTYKRDEQHRVYNYDLFAFYYYAYSLNISFEHLYNSKLLKSLGAYKYTKNRDKPSLKTDVLKRFNDGKAITLQFRCENNIYMENFEKFIQNAELKKINLYILSFLVDMSHSITESKNFLQLITAKDNYHKINYENLPIPINTLLLEPQQIAN